MHDNKSFVWWLKWELWRIGKYLCEKDVDLYGGVGGGGGGVTIENILLPFQCTPFPFPPLASSQSSLFPLPILPIYTPQPFCGSGYSVRSVVPLSLSCSDTQKCSLVFYCLLFTKRYIVGNEHVNLHRAE